MANRQTRRKEQKKKKEVVEEVKVTSDSILNKIIIGLMVICLLGLFYLLTIYITNKHTDKSDTEETSEKSSVSINYDEILIGKTFSMKDNDYIVVLYDPSVSGVADAISSYKNKEDHKPIYYVNMTNTFNKKYTTTEESNKAPSKASELSINGPTLIRITDGNLIEYLEGEEAITNYLN
ncbi:MAG: hypothetical protein IJI58_03760 [Bacilli bacterium]|nr:hypothetical protein [Bacilli bacterium]